MVCNSLLSLPLVNNLKPPGFPSGLNGIDALQGSVVDITAKHGDLVSVLASGVEPFTAVSYDKAPRIRCRWKVTDAAKFSGESINSKSGDAIMPPVCRVYKPGVGR